MLKIRVSQGPENEGYDVRRKNLEIHGRLGGLHQVGGELSLEMAPENRVSLRSGAQVEHKPIISKSRHLKSLDGDERNLAVQTRGHLPLNEVCDSNVNRFASLQL